MSVREAFRRVIHRIKVGDRLYPQVLRGCLERSRSFSSVLIMDLVQRYRLRQLTRAVYDSADTQEDASSPRVRGLMDYPAALAVILLCGLVLIIMVIKSAAWGVEKNEDNLAPMEEAPVSGALVLGEENVVGGGKPAGEGKPPGNRRRPLPDDGPQSAGIVLTIHVEGAVMQAGIVTLNEGARVHDAVKAAGGAQADAALSEINLARKLSDGEYLYVPHQGQDPLSMPTPAQATGNAGEKEGNVAAGAGQAGAGRHLTQASAGGECVNINTEDLVGLQVLNGVGPALAQRIIDARERSGPFLNIDDVDAVSGIGPALLARIEPQLCF